MFMVFACQNEDITQQNNTLSESEAVNEKTLGTFVLLSEQKTNINFNNDVKDRDVKHDNFTSNNYFYMGGGVAIGDINNDGLQDIYFTGNQVGNKLYLNKGDFEFEDITDKAGVADDGFWSTGAAFIDANQDGWLDLYVCHGGRDELNQYKQNHLFINNKDGSFSQKAQEYGLVDNALSAQIAPIDYDLDGDTDLIVINYVDFVDRFRQLSSFKEQLSAYEDYLGQGNHRKECSNILFENLGNGKFVEATEKAGLFHWGYGLSVVVSDIDKDNDPDIYITNDFAVPDWLYLNNGDGTFKEVIKERIGHISHFGMGCDIADLNNDTWADIAVVDMASSDRIRNKTLMAPMDVSQFNYFVNKLQQQKQFMFNSFQLNQGKGYFSEIGQLLNLAQTDWSWSALVMDYDLDTDKDLFVTNGVGKDMTNRDSQAKAKSLNKKLKREDLWKLFDSTPQVNYLFENQGNLNLENRAKEWGLSQATFSNGAAYADLDNDGDLDLVVNNLNERAYVYQNQTREQNKGNYLKIHFDANPKNLQAKATLFHKDERQYQEYNPVRGYFSCMEANLLFGLDDLEKVDSIHIDWLYGQSKVLYDVKANQTLNLSITDDDVKAKPNNKKQNKKTFHEINAKDKGLNFVHQENKTADFKKEVLLPHSQSKHGPHIAVGDINGDEKEDIFVGGACKQLGAVFIQQQNGTFKQKQQGAFEENKVCEDIGSTFFDYDQDGDVDLYVVSGGAEFKPYGPALQDRLYENDGKGNFIKTQGKIPNIRVSGSVVKAYDYDQDGDKDLLIGGRVLPRNYPIPVQTTLLKNNGGVFEDVTEQALPVFKQLGLVTDFEWVDFNKDGEIDIIITGEWMNIEFFEQDNGTFKKVTQQYIEEDMRGWWFSLVAHDFDNDGDVDLMAGNLGLNNKFHANKKKPFDIYFNDFDNNGTNDIVLAKTYEGEQYLMRGKDCSSEQMPFIGEKFDSYQDFANASLSTILSPEKVEKSLHYSIEDFSSVYLENDNGKFIKKKLPIEAQFAPIQDILVKDINKDGHADAIIGGNFFDTEVETPSYDAGVGGYLIGDGKGNFRMAAVEESGLSLRKNLRDLNWIDINKQTYLLIANNNDKLQVIKVGEE